VDVADFEAVEPGADLDSLATPFPGPAVFRLESCHARHSYPWFSSVGGRIAAMRYNEEEEDAPVLLYDTTTGGLAVGRPRAPAEARRACMFIPNGAEDRLYMMGISKFHGGEDQFEVLAEEEEGGRWAWSSVRKPPFSAWEVACHAAHPDGRTIFFSVHGKGTYSFDTHTQEWKHRGGYWTLPFRGRAHYDAQLDAWVGIDRTCGEVSVWSCDVVPSGGDHQGPPPARKLARENLLCEDWRRRKKVAITYLGRGRFCLVEERFRKDVDVDIGDNVYLFYITTFELRYDKDGELRATRRRTRSYTMPNKSRGNNWSVFGI
jgi:hypothetical protein